MADSYARMSVVGAVVALLQGCGLTNAATGLGEAAKSRTPLVVLVGEATDPASNFYIDQDALARSVGASSIVLRSADTALTDVRRAYARSLNDRQTVLLRLPLEVQALDFDAMRLRDLVPVPPLTPPRAADQDIAELITILNTSTRPVFIAGRGARGAAARDALAALADATGALLAEGAVAKGLFAGCPWSFFVFGGGAAPGAAGRGRGAGGGGGGGAARNMWTTAHGRLIA